MTKKRVDAEKNKAKIIKEVLRDPLQSQREVAAKTGLGKSTVQEHLKELPNTVKDGRIKGLLDKDLEILDIIQKEKHRRLTEETKDVNNTDIDKWENTATKRRMIFGGDKINTDDKNISFTFEV